MVTWETLTKSRGPLKGKHLDWKTALVFSVAAYGLSYLVGFSSVIGSAIGTIGFILLVYALATGIFGWYKGRKT